MNTLGASILSALALLVLFAPRRWAVLGMVAAALYLTQGQHLMAGGFTLYPTRVLMVAAILRIVIRKEVAGIVIQKIDRVFVLLYLFSVIVFVLRSKEEISYQIGVGVDAVCLYTTFRALIRDVEDLRWLLARLVLLLIPYVPLLWIESVTYHNPFAAIGGVELIRAGDTWIREGRLRATGSFGHPSLLGTIGGTFLPMYVGFLFSKGSNRLLAVLGVGCCLGIVGASNSGGPLICVVAAAMGWALWPLRHSMQLVRRGIVVILVLLAIVMKAPIWYLLARVSDITGGDGYHRAVLLDVGFQNLSHWWLAGMPARETGAWLPYTNTTTGAVDMTNNFLSFGVNAGLGALLLLVGMIAVAFRQLGRAMKTIREGVADGGLEPIFWGLGTMLGVHVFNWFGITYWDQSSVIWFLHIALISSLTGSILLERSIPKPADLAADRPATPMRPSAR